MLKMSCAGCLGLSPVISVQFTLKMCFTAYNREKFTKNPIYGIQGRSRSSVLVPLERLVMISSKSVSITIYNSSHARLVESSRNCTCWSGYPNLMPYYGKVLEHRGSNLALLKSTFNVENFICRLSWFISSDFSTVHSWNVCRGPKSRKIY